MAQSALATAAARFQASQRFTCVPKARDRGPRKPRAALPPAPAAGVWVLRQSPSFGANSTGSLSFPTGAVTPQGTGWWCQMLPEHPTGAKLSWRLQPLSLEEPSNQSPLHTHLPASVSLEVQGQDGTHCAVPGSLSKEVTNLEPEESVYFGERGGPGRHPTGDGGGGRAGGGGQGVGKRKGRGSGHLGVPRPAAPACPAQTGKVRSGHPPSSDAQMPPAAANAQQGTTPASLRITTRPM